MISSKKQEAVRLRLEERLSIHEVAEKIGIAKSTASLWLRGTSLTDEEKKTRRDKRSDVAPIVNFGKMFRLSEKQDLHEASTLVAISTSIARAWYAAIPGFKTNTPDDQYPYDLLVDSGERFFRVQVKTTTQIDRSGKWIVHVHKRVHDPSASARRKQVPYKITEVDVFFILTANLDVYVVPIEAAYGKMALTLDEKYSKFKEDRIFLPGHMRNKDRTLGREPTIVYGGLDGITSV